MYTLANGMVAGDDRFILTDRHSFHTEHSGPGNSNVLMLGSSGSGKSTGGIIPNIMQLNSSMVLIDQKGALHRKLAAGLKAAGFDVEVLDFIHPENSTVHWNPLVHLKTDEEEEAFTRKLFLAHGKSNDPYWDLSPSLYFRTLLEGLKEEHPNKRPTMREIVELSKRAHKNADYKDPQKSDLATYFFNLAHDPVPHTYVNREKIGEFSQRIDELEGEIIRLERGGELPTDSEGKEVASRDEMISYFKSQQHKLRKHIDKLSDDSELAYRPRESRAYDMWQEVSHNADSTFACILSEFSIKLAPFTTSALLDLMDNGPQIDFKRLGRVSDEQGRRVKPTALFIICSDTSRALDPLISVLESQLFDELVRLADDEFGGQLEQPVTFYLDDFASGTPLADAPKLVANVRSRRIRMVMSVQSLSQLTRLYGDEAESIVTNCDVRLIFGGVGNVVEAAILNRGQVLPDNIARIRNPNRVIVFQKGSEVAAGNRFDPTTHPNFVLFESARMDAEDRSAKPICQHDEQLTDFERLFMHGPADSSEVRHGR